MLFVVSIGLTSFAALVVGVNKNAVLEALEDVCYKDHKHYHSPGLLFISVLTLAVQLLPIGAFLASAEAVRAYHNTVGIVTWVVVSIIGLIMIAFWIGQNRYARIHVLLYLVAELHAVEQCESGFPRPDEDAQGGERYLIKAHMLWSTTADVSSALPETKHFIDT